MTMEELVIAIRVSAENAEERLGAISEGLKRIGLTGAGALGNTQRKLDELMNSLKNTSALRAQAEGYRELAQQVKQAGGTWGNLSGEVQRFARQIGVADGDVDGLITELSGLEQSLDDAISSGVKDVKKLGGELETLRAQLLAIPPAQITADNRQALSAINVALAAADSLLEMFGQIGSEAQKTGEEKLTSVHKALSEALQNRYEEQREIEQRRIKDSIAAWETWSDETCAAIRQQMDLLDEQAQAEDREKTRAENLRGIAKLEQALVYETDAYNREQLKKQIEQAKAAWEDVQSAWARADKRDALESQMQAVQKQAQAEKEKLQAEGERIDSVYDSMMKGASLAAEAQKLMMEGAQTEILQLLASYAPDYEATGRTLGERIYEGFKNAFGDVSAFFEMIDAQFEAMTDKAQQAALGKTIGVKASGENMANVSSPTINQTVNFNQPVESPADVARRMQKVSEELAGMV